MKKLLQLLLILGVFSIIIGCAPEDTSIDCELYPTHLDCLEDDVDDNEDDIEDPLQDLNFIDIYYLNDFHGAIFEDGDSIGFEGIGNHINNQRQTYPDNIVVIAGGDMLQGSALSNYYNGYSTLAIMEEIGFDAFILGNHEFDWGLETVTAYFDGNNDNKEVSFPLLGANVFLEGTTTIPDHIDPYTIITRGDVRIGVIGTMGYNLEYSIATSKISGYEFAHPVSIIEQYAIELRTQQDCDIVIWVGHDTGTFNQEIQELSGDAKIDALFNAHSHQEYVNTFGTSPIVQSGDTGENLGHVRLLLDEDNQVESFEAKNLSKYESAYFINEYAPIADLIDSFYSEVEEVFSETIMISEGSYNSSKLSVWIAELMRVSTNADIGYQNYGGTRASINANEHITYGKLYEIWPFDNVVKTVYLPGSIINNLNATGLAYSTTIEVFEEDQLYKVATNDYIFDKDTNPFLSGTDITVTSIVMRELVLSELYLQKELFDYFNTENPLQTTN